jgi:molecular chaperone GrpE
MKNNDQINNHIIKDTTDNRNSIIQDLKMKILCNEKKIQEIKLRNLANIDNFKKNIEKTTNEIKINNTEIFFQKIIPIIDSLEEILTLFDTSQEQHQPLIEGIQLTLQSFLNTVTKFGVHLEGKKNEEFNSTIHDAVLYQKSSDITPNHIIFVNKKGYTFNKTVLRKARVTISKK